MNEGLADVAIFIVFAVMALTVIWLIDRYW